MAAIKVCRVCGKEYEACHTVSRNAGVFRWQEVACSPECGSVYLQKINESRGIVEPKVSKRKEEAPQLVVEPVEEPVIKDEVDPVIEGFKKYRNKTVELTDETPVEFE